MRFAATLEAENPVTVLKLESMVKILPDRCCVVSFTLVLILVNAILGNASITKLVYFIPQF